MSRRAVVVVLMVVSAALLVFGGAGLYVQREFLDSARFSDRLVSALRNDDVRAALTREVTAAIEKGRPDLIAARPVIRAAVARVAASPQFQAALRTAAAGLHTLVFDRHRETVELTVRDAGVLVVDRVRRVSPQVADRLAAAIEKRSARLVTVHDEATFAARRVESLASAAVPALAIAAIMMALALLLAGSARARLMALGLTVALAGAVGFVGLAIGRGALLDSVVHGSRNRSAGGAVWDAYVGGFRGWCLGALVGGLVLAAVGAFMPKVEGNPRRAKLVADVGER